MDRQKEETPSEPVVNVLNSTSEEEQPAESPNSSVPEFINLNEHKAGLDGLDKERINKIIQEASKGSRFYIHQQNRQKRTDAKIVQLRNKLKNLTEAQLKAAVEKADAVIDAYESERVLNRIMVHFDMDMFFAAVEIKYNPSLADKPVAVGSMSMISTSNYIARKFGVRSAMAGFIAKRLCDKLVLIKPRFKVYSQESNFIMNIIAEYDPNLDSLSLDEVHIDLTDYVFRQYSAEKSIDIAELYKLQELPDEIWNYAFDIVDKIRARVFNESQLSVSAGISCNKLLAKVCTDINKPNGQFMVKGHRNEILEFVSNIGVRKFPGVGPVSGQILSAFNIETGRDIYNHRGTIFNLFYEHNAHYYMKLARGIGAWCVSNDDAPQKSHSCERTMGELSKFEDMCPLLVKLSQNLSRDLKSHNQLARTITLKLKKTTFEVFLKSKSINNPTDDEHTILKVAKELLCQEIAKSPTTSYRLIGIKVSNLKDKNAVNTSSSQPTLLQLFQNASTSKRNESGNDCSLNEEEKEDDGEEPDHFECRICEQTFIGASEFDLHRLECEGDLEMSSLEEFDNDPVERNLIEQQECESNLMPSVSKSTPSPEPQLPIERFYCPVCGQLGIFDNDQLNRHIDICLNKDIVIELTKVNQGSTSSTTSSTNASPAANGSAKSKRNLTSKSSEKKSSSKRFRSHSPENTQSKIDNFFVKK